MLDYFYILKHISLLVLFLHKHAFSWWNYLSEDSRFKKQCHKHSSFYLYNSHSSITTAVQLASSTTENLILILILRVSHSEHRKHFLDLAVAREYALKTFSQPLWNQFIKRKVIPQYPLICTNLYFNALFLFYTYICIKNDVFHLFLIYSIPEYLTSILTFFATGKITKVKDWADRHNHSAIEFEGAGTSLNDSLKHPRFLGYTLESILLNLSQFP